MASVLPMAYAAISDVELSRASFEERRNGRNTATHRCSASLEARSYADGPLETNARVSLVHIGLRSPPSCRPARALKTLQVSLWDFVHSHATPRRSLANALPSLVDSKSPTRRVPFIFVCNLHMFTCLVYSLGLHSLLCTYTYYPASTSPHKPLRQAAPIRCALPQAPLPPFPSYGIIPTHPATVQTVFAHVALVEGFTTCCNGAAHPVARCSSGTHTRGSAWDEANAGGLWSKVSAEIAGGAKPNGGVNGRQPAVPAPRPAPRPHRCPSARRRRPGPLSPPQPAAATQPAITIALPPVFTAEMMSAALQAFMMGSRQPGARVFFLLLY
ncbi:hypothetical protein B0H14DRAFT_3469177 [Mycena olivaceomarginata]|nr:hypothetical protein B0H14DRAFT_3469177 [Mycena olivaceomarginata]